MKITEICARIDELECHIDLLKKLREEMIESNRDNEYVRALDDGIQYTNMRLEQYQNSNWIMAFNDN